MPYHICILLPNEVEPSYVLDLSKEILTERILTPYKNGENFIFSGKTISPTNIRQFQIVQTEKSSEELMPSIRAQIRAKQEVSGVIAAIPDEFYLMEHGTDITDELLTQPPMSSSDSQAEEVSNTVTSDRDVFVVHGRNEKIRSAMFQFLRSINLNPLEWNKAVELTGKSAPYVGEILDAAFSRARAVVVLLTPDDMACLRKSLLLQNDPDYESQPTPQARPNVLFEAGMAMGRKQDSTILVQIGDLRPFSDIGGRHVIRFDGSFAKRQDLANRLKSAGCKADMTGNDWHTEGSFKLDEPDKEEFAHETNTQEVHFDKQDVRLDYSYDVDNCHAMTGRPLGSQSHVGYVMIPWPAIFVALSPALIDGITSETMRDELDSLVSSHVRQGILQELQIRKEVIITTHRNLNSINMDNESFKEVKGYLFILDLIETRDNDSNDPIWKLTELGVAEMKRRLKNIS